MNTRNLYLEGLRGILAIIVVIHHFILLFIPKLFIGSFNVTDFKTNPYSLDILLANTPLNIFMNGGWAVCMFFTLSGFVLSLKYFKSADTKVIQGAIAKRYLRLAIPILASCLLIFLLHFSGLFKNTFYPRSHEEYSFGKNLFLNDLSFFETIKMALFNVPINGDNTYFPILWTMEVEFLGALLLFVFLLSVHQLKSKWIFYAAIILVLFLMNKNYIILFFAGSFIACYEDKIKILFRSVYLKTLILIVGFYFAGIPNLQNEAKQYTIYAFTNYFSAFIYLQFHIISCFLFFLFLVSSEFPKKMLSNKGLLFLGKNSFSIYLIHLPVLFIVGSYFLNKTAGKINYLLLFGICFSVTIILSYAFYYLIDSKAVLYANKLAKRLIKIN